MKKPYFRALICAAMMFVCLFMLPGEACAAEMAGGQCGENVFWSLDEGGTLTISGQGDMYEYVAGSGVVSVLLPTPWKQWEGQIHTIVIESGVTGIGSGAIYKLPSLAAVYIADTVEYCGSLNFGGCGSLTQIHITDLSTWCLINFEESYSNPFYGKDQLYLYLNGEPVVDLVIPDDVPYVGMYAFAHYHALRSVAVGKGLEDIAPGAFAGCKNLQEVRLGKDTRRIWESAFSQCDALRVIHLPASLEEVGEKAFLDCNALQDIHLEDVAAWVSIPDENILSEPISNSRDGVRRFYLDGKLITDLVIPEGVTVIREHAFRGAEDITAIHYPSTITDLGEYSLERCVNLQDIYLADMAAYLNAACQDYGTNPMEINELPKNLYLKGKLVKELVIPGSVTSIRHGAFINCTGITSVKLESGVQKIGRSAFAGCTGLKSITYPDTLAWVGDDALLGCTALTDIHITDIRSWLNCERENYNGNPMMANELEKSFYLNGKLITDLVVPEGVTQIPFFTFYKYTKLKSITLPKTVTAIGRSAFEGCTGLTKITIPGGVEVVPEKVFQDCTGLTEAVVGEGVRELEMCVFWNCPNLKKVTLPSTLEKAGFGCFYDCDALDEIYAADLASWLNIQFESHILDVNFLEKKLHIGGKLLTEAVIPEEIEEIPDFAFHDCKSLTSVKLPKSLKTIGESSFEGCNGITQIQLPEGLTAIGKKAFSGVYHLSEVKLPSTLTTLGERAFYNIWDLTSIDIPGSVAVIGNSAFAHCNKLAKITLHEGLQVIESHAFNGCIAKGVVIPEGVTTLEWGAFVAAQKLEWVVLPASLTTIGKGTFEHSDDLWHVLYTGTENQWKAMSVAEKNDCLFNAIRHYDAKGDEVTGKLCSLCGNTCDHKWGSGVITKEPTCTVDGERTFTCSGCGEKRTEVAGKTGHIGGPAATTESPQVCVICGVVLQAALPKPVTTVPPVTAAPATVPATTAEPTTEPETTAEPTTEPETTAAPTTTQPETTAEPTTVPETTISAPTAAQPGNGGVWIVVGVILLVGAIAAAAVVIMKRHPELLDKLRRKK